MTRLTQGQRKTVMFFGQLATAAVLCWHGNLDGQAFVTLQTFAFGAVVAGNAAEHFSKRGQVADAQGVHAWAACTKSSTASEQPLACAPSARPSS